MLDRPLLFHVHLSGGELCCRADLTKGNRIGTHVDAPRVPDEAGVKISRNAPPLTLMRALQ